jgi:hypothetical protein
MATKANRKGNGGREALSESVAVALANCKDAGNINAEGMTDWLLMLLWERGFKVTPLDKDNVDGVR